MTDLSDIFPDGNWCPDCGEPRGVCTCIAHNPKILQLAEDMSMAGVVKTVEEAARRIQQALVLAFEAHTITALTTGIYKWIDNMPKKQRKSYRRRRRHYFFTHGKHGLRRPRGKRNVPA